MLDSLLSAVADTTGFAELVIIKDLNVIYSYSSNSQPDKVRIASAAKWLTAATLLALVDEGLLELDEPIGKHLQQFTGEKGEITLRQLLTHSSGFAPNSIYLKDENLSLEASLDSIVQNVNLVARPGTQFIYGGVSMQVAARLAEMVTGKDWETIFQEKIALPCRMPQTDYGKTKSKNIGDGVYSTAPDYANFLLMISNKGMFNGTKVLSSAMVEEMLSDQTGSLEIGHTSHRFSSDKHSGYYGLGVWIDRMTINDNVVSEVSSPGAKGFVPWLNLCKDVGGVFSCNTGLETANQVISQTKSILDSAFPKDCNDVPTRSNIPPEEVVSDSIVITFSLVVDAAVRLKLYDSLGNEVKELANSIMEPGDHTIVAGAKSLRPGIYFYRLMIDDRSETKKISIGN